MNLDNDPTQILDEPKGDAPRLERGSVVGRYVVVDVIGEGGMGVVYMAFDPDLGRPVALKFLLVDRQGVAVEVAHRRLLREARALAKLSHPNVVTIYEVGIFRDAVFLATEFISGPTLRKWLASAPRTTAAILDAFLAAGEGLAAAHRAGIVHRDFKPDNVILGDDGRVRVLDFGLARAPADPSADALDQAAGLALSSNHGLELTSSLGLSSVDDAMAPITRAGVILGTPRYMAPEQHLGLSPDDRTDQFTFAVVLYEALYRSHPFAAKTAAQTKDNVLRGAVAPTPRNARVPRWLRAALVRALSADPVARYASMTELLAALRADPTTKIRRWGGWALAVALVAAAPVAYAHARSTCEGASARLEGVWDAASKDRVRVALEGSGLPYARSVATSVGVAFDAFAHDWVRGHEDACRATRVRGEQSEELLDLRMTCLHAGLEGFRARIRVLEKADEDVVRHAVETAQSLPAVDACSDIVALRAAVKPPPTPEARARVAAVRADLATVFALRSAYKLTEALALAERSLTAARALGYPPLTAEALFALGRVEERQGATEPSTEHFTAAAAEGTRSKVASLSAAALIRIAWQVADGERRMADAQRFEDLAAPFVEETGSGELRGDLARSRATTHYRMGSYPESLRQSRRALEEYEKALGPRNLKTVDALTDIADVLGRTFQHEEALAIYERATAIQDELLGKDHPDHARFFNNMSFLRRQIGQFGRAAELAERALRLEEANLGPDHPALVNDLVNLGLAQLGEGKVKEARVHLARAVAIDEVRTGPANPLMSVSLRAHAATVLDDGEPAAAEAIFRRARDISEKGLGSEHPEVALGFVGIGRTELARKEYERAEASFEKAIAMLAPLPTMVFDLAETRFLLAQTLEAEGKDRARARALADEARRAFETLGPMGASPRAAIARWQPP